jgi:redox-sensing transcriptional repressor
MISDKVIKRFLQYRICLIKFQRLGFEKVFSYNLGEEVGVTPEQVRKDFSYFGIKGNRKGGYSIDKLLKSISEIFKRDEDRNIIIMGMGNIGKALANYKGFPENRIFIVAAFDLDPAKYTKKFNIPVYHPDKLEKIVKKYNIRTAVIAVPEFAGQEVCDKLVSLGISGILNFSPVILRVPDNIYVNNVNLRSEIESLFYYI